MVDDEYLKNEWVKRKTFDRLVERLSPFVSGQSRMLEVGAYCGLFMDSAKAAGWNIVGIEPSRWAAQIAGGKGHEVTQGTLSDVASRLADPVDTVVLWDVLEHLEDPVTDLRILHSKLAADGTLCLSTIDMDGWFSKLLGKRWPWIMHMHLYYFTTNTLDDVLRRAGFSLTEALPYHHYASVRYATTKVAALLPPGLSNIAAAAAKLIPKRIVLPIYLGDVKLYIAKPMDKMRAGMPEHPPSA